jgi:tetratricopeptide (TPR) repeat protein
VLEAGAVLGRRFSPEDLAAVAGVSEADASVVAAEALRRQLLEDAGAELAFVHDRIREVVYARIAPERRAALHLVAAERAAAIGANEAAGAHYAAAGRPEQASLQLCAAARKASGRAAYDDADRLYELAMAHGTRDDVLRLRLERIAETYEPRGRYREAAAEAEAIAAEATAPITSIGAHRAVSRLLYRQGRHAEAVAPLRRTLSLAEALGDPHPIRGALNNLAVVLRELGQLEQARELFEREERLWADEPMSRERAQCVGNLAMIDQFMGRLGEAERRLAEVLAIQNALPDAALDQNITLWNLFSGALARYDWPRAERLADETLQLSLHLGDRVGEASAWWGLALCRAELGRYGEAEEAARRSMATYAGMGNHRDADASEALIGVAAFRAGRFDEAEAMLERSRVVLIASSYASEVWRVTLELAALVRVVRGDLARADALLDGIADLARPVGRARWPAARGLLAVARGEPADEWLRAAERAHGACETELDAHPEVRALRLALAAIGSGRPELLRNGEPIELLTPAQRAALDLR